MIADVVLLHFTAQWAKTVNFRRFWSASDIRYTGSDYCGSLLAMDKDLSKKLIRFCGVTDADWLIVDAANHRCKKFGRLSGFL